MYCSVIQLKNATVDDIEPIASLHARSWQDNYHQVLSSDYLRDTVFTERRAVWSQRLTSPKSNQHVIIAKVDGKFAGFICIYGANHELFGTIIDNLHVEPAYKGRGIGTGLLKAAAEWANQFNATLPLYLEVLACNPKAIGFYSSLGAEHIATSYWHTPCHNEAKELLYSWPSAQTLICQSMLNQK